MMNTMINKKLNMDELTNINGGGFFDSIVDFVEDIVENPPFEIPDIGGPVCTFILMVGDRLIEMFSNNLYDTLVDEKRSNNPSSHIAQGLVTN